MQERTLETIRTLMDSGNLDAASQKIKEVVDSKILEPFDPRVQRLSEQILDAQTAPTVVPSSPASPAISKEYAFLSATPIPEAPPIAENKPPAEALSPQASATQSIGWTQPAPVPPPSVHIPPTERVVPAEPTPVAPVKPETVKPVPAEPVKAEPVKAEPTKAEPTKAEPVKVEPVKAEPVASKPAAAEPVVSTPRPAEPVPAPVPYVKPPKKKSHRAAPPAPVIATEPIAEPIQDPKPVQPSKSILRSTPVLVAIGAALAISAWAAVHFLAPSQPESAITRVKPDNGTANPAPPVPAATSAPAKPAPNPAETQQRDAIALSDRLVASGELNGAMDALKNADKISGPLTADLKAREDTITKLKNNDAMAKLWVQATKEMDQADFAAAKRDLEKLAKSETGPRHTEAHRDLDEVLPRRQKEEDLFRQAERNARGNDQKALSRANGLLDQVIALDGPRKTEAMNLQHQISAKLGTSTQNAAKVQNPPVAPQPLPSQAQQQQPAGPSQETKDWNQARDSNDASQLEQYIATYPGGAHSQEAQAKLQDLAWSRTRQDDISALDAYTKRFPSSPHAQEASRRMDDLRWNKTNKNDSGELTDFLSRYPGSAHSGDARSQLNQLSAAASAKAAAANSAAANTAANNRSPAPVAPPVKSTSDADIRATIQRYANAFNNRDADALRSVWPTLGPRYGKYKDSFRMARSIQEQVTIDSVEISADGTKATVRGQSSLDYTSKSGPSPHTVTSKAVFQLAKSAAGWTITDVQ
jgi:outer membrane protein assembly factor BamD (BamD/ComL family)/ketosteroid isomerase-like protein